MADCVKRSESINSGVKVVDRQVSDLHPLATMRSGKGERSSVLLASLGEKQLISRQKKHTNVISI
jgi:hypothetical protein